MDSKQIDLEKKLTELDDETLIEEIKKANEEQLTQIGLMAYTEIFNRTLYLRAILEENSELVESLKNEEKEFKEICEKFENEILDLNSVRHMEKSEALNTEELIELRRRVAKLLRCLTAYITEISYTNEISKDKVYLDFISQNFTEIEENMDLDRLVQNVQMFLSEDARTIKAKVNDIVSVIPIKVSKYKYYDMLEGAFNKTLKEASKEMIDIILSRYKFIFDGRLEKEYGVCFDRYFMKAEESNRLEFKDMDESTLHKVYEETSETIMEINNIAGIIREFGVVLNRLIAISMLREPILKGLKDNGDIKTLLTDWNNYLDNPKTNRAKVMESYNSTFEKLNAVFTDNNIRLQNMSMENFNRGNKVEDDLKASLENTQYILSFINDYSVEREEITPPTYYEPAGDAYLKESIKSLTEYIDRNSKNMLNVQRKARMKRLLSLVEGVFQTPQEFFEYLVNSLNLASSKAEKIAMANNILEVMNKYRGSGNNIKH